MRSAAERGDRRRGAAARLCQLDERRYANYANDQREPDLMTLAKIARVLNTSADHLLGLTDPQPQTEQARLLDRLIVAAASLTDEELLAMSGADVILTRRGRHD